MLKKFMKDNQYFLYEVVIKNNKHTYLRIKDQHVIITTNRRMVPFVETILNQQFDKIMQRLKSIHEENNQSITLWGKVYEFYFEAGRFRYSKLNDKIFAFGKDVQTAKKQIYLKEMKKMIELLEPKVLKVISINDIKPSPLKFKYLKSKFGSYHRKHNEITLNTFLATVDPIFLEYVLYHEYAHKKVFNHSKDFYDILDTWMPGHKNIQKALKKMAIL